jgi:hypothetical protein
LTLSGSTGGRHIRCVNKIRRRAVVPMVSAQYYQIFVLRFEIFAHPHIETSAYLLCPAILAELMTELRVHPTRVHDARRLASRGASQVSPRDPEKEPRYGANVPMRLG